MSNAEDDPKDVLLVAERRLGLEGNDGTGGASLKRLSRYAGLLPHVEGRGSTIAIVIVFLLVGWHERLRESRRHRKCLYSTMSTRRRMISRYIEGGWSVMVKAAMWKKCDGLDQSIKARMEESPEINSPTVVSLSVCS